MTIEEIPQFLFFHLFLLQKKTVQHPPKSNDGCWWMPTLTKLLDPPPSYPFLTSYQTSHQQTIRLFLKFVALSIFTLLFWPQRPWDFLPSGASEAGAINVHHSSRVSHSPPLTPAISQTKQKNKRTPTPPSTPPCCHFTGKVVSDNLAGRIRRLHRIVNTLQVSKEEFFISVRVQAYSDP